MPELQLLHESTVLPEQIDHLGHMNVRFYLENALRASGALAAQHGLGPHDCAALDGRLELRDAFTRHYREQLVGAPLAVLGAVLDVHADGLRFYHELRNTGNGERAATFVHRFRLVREGAREPLPVPEAVAKRVGDALLELPEHGGPRTLDLDRLPPKLGLEEAHRRGLAMRKEREIRVEECDDAGFFPAASYQDLVWGGEPPEGRPFGPPVYELPGGGRFGWATLESRGVLFELPRAGSRIQSFAAEVQTGAKISVTRCWVLDVGRDAVLCTSSIVNLAFDIGARRAIEIPAPVRATLESRYHPDLR